MSTTHTRNLIHLPDDCLIAILELLSTDSLLCAIYASRRIFDLLEQTRTLITKHLKQIPGICDDELNSLPNISLFCTLRKRGFRHLFGVRSLADCREYIFGQPLNLEASTLSAHGSDGIRACLVYEGSPNVHVITCDGAHQSDIAPSPRKRNLKVMQVAHASTSSVILYRCEKPSLTGEQCMQRLGVPLLSNSDIVVENFLLIEYDHATNLEMCSVKYQVNFGRCGGAIMPASLDVSDCRRVAIVWCCSEDWSMTVFTEGTLPGRDESNPGHVEPICVIGLERWNSDPGSHPRHIRYTPRCDKLKAYDMCSRTPRWMLFDSSSDYDPDADSSLDHDPDAFDNAQRICSGYSVEIPFYPAVEDKHKWELIPHDKRPHEITCLCLGTQDFSHSAGEPEAELDILRYKIPFDQWRAGVFDQPEGSTILNYEAVAELGVWGPRDEKFPESIAVNAAGSRIAVIRSTDIVVWSLEPEVLCNMSSADMPSVEADNFYYMWPGRNQDSGSICRPPHVILDCGGPTPKKLKWNEKQENELVVLTTRGFQVWDLGPGASGQRTRKVMNCSKSSDELVRGIAIG